MRTAALASILLACASVPISAQAGVDSVAHYTGAIRFRGDSWPVRLTLHNQDSLSAALDLPELGMAWEPVPVRRRGDTLTVEVPFGLGEFSLIRSSEGFRGVRVLGGDSALMFLGSDPAPPYSRETIQFSNGEATLVGTIVQPSGAGPHPAVVLIHGSSPQGRSHWGYRSWADWFARQGFVVLLYDKRGVGESTGPWMTTSFADIADLAGDAKAAVNLLRGNPAVDPDRIGLAGGSQAGWVSLLAADSASGVAFLILRSAPATTPARQEIESVEYRLRATDLPQAAVDSALNYTRLYFDVVGGGKPWAELAAAAASARWAVWGEYVQIAESEDDLYWWRMNAGVDPGPRLADLSLPALFVYGAADPVVPPQLNIPRLLEHLPAGADATIVVLPRADHSLEQPSGRDPAGNWKFPRKAPGLFDTMSAWLAERGLVSPPTTTSVNQELSPDMIEAIRRGPVTGELAERVTSVPLVGKPELPLVEVMINDRGPYRLLIDLGSNVTILRRAVADEAGVETLVERPTSDILRMNSLAIGTAVFQDATGAAYDELDVDGVLGYNLLRMFPFTMDYPAMRFTFERDAVPDEGDPNLVPIEIHDRMPFVRVTSGADTLMVNFDTGATEWMTIPAAWEDRVQFTGTPATGPRTSNNQTGAADVRQAELANDLQLGRHTIRNVPVYLNPDADDAWLGSSLLKDFVLSFYPDAELVRIARP